MLHITKKELNDEAALIVQPFLSAEPLTTAEAFNLPIPSAFLHHLPMLARVLSAAASRQSRPWATTADAKGIEAFPVEVEVNSGWGDTIIVQMMSISPI